MCSRESGAGRQRRHPNKSMPPATRDLQAGHWQGLALGFPMKKCEGSQGAGLGGDRGWGRRAEGLRLT